MKKTILALFTLIAAVACYQDLSTSATFEYPDIVITTDLDAQGDTLVYAYGETIVINAEYAQEGVDPSLLTCSWEMDIASQQSRTRAEISDTKTLEYLLTNTPDAVPYCLSFTVTNTESGFSAIRHWSLYVSNSLGEGLLVADTHDGGLTSDLQLLCAKPVTYGFVGDEPRVTENIFSLGNGEPIDGRVNTITCLSWTDMDAPSPKSFGVDRVLMGTDKHIMALDPTNYKVDRMDAEMINGKAKSNNYCTVEIDKVCNYSGYAIIDGYLYCLGAILDKSFGPVPHGAPNAHVYSAECGASTYEAQGWYVMFDSETHRFYGCPGWCMYQSSMNEIVGDESPEGDWLDGVSLVATGGFKGLVHCFVMKDAADKYYAVLLDPFGGSADQIYELNLPDVEKAVTWTFCENANVFYYATPDKIYSTIISGGAAATKALNFTTGNASEKITMVKQYLQGWYGSHQYGFDKNDDSRYYQFQLDTNRAQILVVTYNETTGEGKIYMKPFNVSTGMFSAFKDNGVYGGFGEITALCGALR